MGAVAGHLASNPTVTITSRVYSNGSSQRYTHANLAREDVSHLAVVIEAALREAMTQYDVRVKADIRDKGQPRYFYVVSVKIASLGALDFREWRARVDAAWQRVLQWREENRVAQTWKRVDAYYNPYDDLIDGSSVTVDFRLYNELADA